MPVHLPGLRAILPATVLVVGIPLLSCGGHSTPGPASGVAISLSTNSTRFVTREHFLAAAEMQISGEPLAQAMKRDLGGYSRDHFPPNIYFDSSPLSPTPWIDLPGFATAVESYEYSKQPMNNVAMESGAGTSLLYGPLFNGSSGTAALGAVADLVQLYAHESHGFGRFVFPAGTFPVSPNVSGDPNPYGVGLPSENPLGWPGFWPTVHVFQSFDPTITPVADWHLYCAITSDDNPGAKGGELVSNYECDYTGLHLPQRETQVDFTITPGADGFSGWKYSLWVLNYLEVMHDSQENPVTSVPAGQLSLVGTTANQVVGTFSGSTALVGTYKGSSDIEGFQAPIMTEEMDNRAQDWLMNLTTVDGAVLSGFSSLYDADAYGYQSPLRWFPGAIAVTETSTDGTGFPRPAYSLASPDSTLLDLLGMSLGYAGFYAMTDRSNPDVGGNQTYQVYFSGDPFPADDQLADGESTLHDRALGMMRVAMVNMDRLHTDPVSGYLVDEVTMNGASPSRGSTIGTMSVAYSIIAIRQVLRSLSSQLELYSNNTPDTAVGDTPLDALAIDYPGDPSLTFTQRLKAIQAAQADLLLNHLTEPSGQAWPGWNVVTGTPTSTEDLLDSHTAAIRGLFSAYLATGDTRYRDRGMAVFNRMEQVFYYPEARIYTESPAPQTTMEFTPVRFALLESALRDVYEVVATRPGGETLELDLESRIGRLIKLVLNGWDDRNQDRIVEWPDECLQVDASGLPRGGLQMAERALSGELGFDSDGDDPIPRKNTDHDQDCVPEVAAAQLPSALADSVTFTLTPR